MGCTHLTEDERYHIYELIRQGRTTRQIASELGRHHATVARELKRDRGLRGYRPKQAQAAASERQSHASRFLRARRIPEYLKSIAMQKIEEGWSPDQISKRFRKDGTGQISSETIYRLILADKKEGGELYKNLRLYRKYKRRFKGPPRASSSLIPNRTDICERPPSVETRKIFGHWEGDTVIGRNHKGAIVTLVERKTRFTIAVKVERKTAQAVAHALRLSLKGLKEHVRSITYDNGLEFAEHQQVSDYCGSTAYFTEPYKSWQRGTNENTNGLLRQYIPKKTSFASLTEDALNHIVEGLNNRPRRCLDYATPYEAFRRCAEGSSVALYD